MAVHAAEGAVLKLSTNTIAQVISITGPGMSVGEVETTNLASTTKTSRPSTQPDPGSLSATIQYDPGDSTHQSLTTLMATPAVSSWTVEFSDGSTYAFSGYLTSFEPSNEIDENLMADIEIRLTGSITITPAGA